jgi:hypothetical protein
LGVPLELILAHCVLQSKLVSGVYFMFHYIGTKTKQRVRRVRYAQEEEAVHMVVFIVLFVSQQAQCLTLQVARANQTQPNIVTSWTRSNTK